MEQPIRVVHIIGKWVGGGVEAVVVDTCKETLSYIFFEAFKIRHIKKIKS